MSMAPEYEFNQEQNAHLTSLAGKMSFVGFFSIAFGVIGLLVTILVIVAIYAPNTVNSSLARLERQLPENTPAEVKEAANNLTRQPANYLWGIAIYSGVTGLFFLLLGVWTRAAGASFQKIVDTQGNDMSNLMNAINSLSSMYGLLYMLLMVALLGGLLAIGLTLYQYFVVQ